MLSSVLSNYGRTTVAGDCCFSRVVCLHQFNFPLGCQDPESPIKAALKTSDQRFLLHLSVVVVHVKGAFVSFSPTALYVTHTGFSFGFFPLLKSTSVALANKSTSKIGILLFPASLVMTFDLNSNFTFS